MQISKLSVLALVIVCAFGMYEHEKGRNDWKQRSIGGLIDELIFLPDFKDFAFLIAGNILNPMSMYGGASPWRREL